MKILIIGAMEKETLLVSSSLKNKQTLTKDGYVFEIGNLYNHEIILTVSSIGKVASGMLMGVVRSTFKNIDKIINIGVAGGVKGKVTPGEVVISTKTAYSDADAREFGYKYGQVPGCPLFFNCDEEMFNKVTSKVYKGTILTADIFQTNEYSVNSIINTYFKEDNVLALDMESCAFNQCAYKMNTGFIAIRAISDVIGDTDQTNKYENALEMACSKAYTVLIEILQNL